MTMDLLATSLLLSLAAAAVSSFFISLFQKPLRFPIVNVKKGEKTWANARKRFVNNAAELLREGQRLVSTFLSMYNWAC